jgi:arylsulfatase
MCYPEFLDGATSDPMSAHARRLARGEQVLPLGARLVAAAAAAAVCLACGGGRPPAAAPNVLLVTVDTVRADHLGAYGFALDTSPHLDALAAASALFERAIAASSRTAPSHASVMTSRWVREHSIGHHNGSTRLAEAEATLAATFREAGYATAAFISNAMLQRRVGLDRGFDHYDDELPLSEVNRADAFERRADRTTERASAWLSELRGAPFFLWVQYNDPHGPYAPPPPYDERFQLAIAPDEAPLPVLYVQRGWFGIPAYQALPGLRRPSEYRSRYAGEIRYFDEWLGRLLAAARHAAGTRDLAVLLTADHGESLGEDGFYFSHGHATTPDLSHVPFLLSAPGVAAGRRAEIAHHVDVLPTLLELAGLPIPAGARGIALGPVLRGEAAFPDRTVFCDVGAEVGAYRRDLFLRARLGASLGDTRRGTWTAYRWRVGGSLVPAAEAQVLRSDIEAYARVRPAIAAAAELSPAEAERLRALGYLGPAAASASAD